MGKKRETPKPETHRRKTPGLLDAKDLGKSIGEAIKGQYVKPGLSTGRGKSKPEDVPDPRTRGVPPPAEGPTVRTAKPKEKMVIKRAILKASIDANVLRRLKMTAADLGCGVGDLLSEALDHALPDWGRK